MKLDSRKGFSNRATAAMFAATVINFLLSSLNTGTQVAIFIGFIRQVLILDVDYPLVEKLGLVVNSLQNVTIANVWAANLPVSFKLSLSDHVSNYACWRYCSAISLSFGGLGPSSQINNG